MSAKQVDLGQILENARGQMGKSVGIQSNALDFVFNECSTIILKQQEEIQRLNELLVKAEKNKIPVSKIEPPKNEQPPK